MPTACCKCRLVVWRRRSRRRTSGRLVYRELWRDVCSSFRRRHRRRTPSAHHPTCWHRSLPNCCSCCSRNQQPSPPLQPGRPALRPHLLSRRRAPAAEAHLRQHSEKHAPGVRARDSAKGKGGQVGLGLCPSTAWPSALTLAVTFDTPCGRVGPRSRAALPPPPPCCSSCVDVHVSCEQRCTRRRVCSCSSWQEGE